MRCAAVYLAILCACGGKSADPAEPGDLQSEIASARYAVAADPSDMAAHVRLAQLYEKAQRPGGALRHYEIAELDGKLGARDRPRLAALYRARAKVRLDLGDGGAIDDVRAALRLAPKTSLGATETEAYFLAAATALRRGDREDRLRAIKLLSAAKKRAPNDDRLALLDPDKATTRALGNAAMWAYRHKAKRVALELFELYVSRDGRRREHLLAWMDVYRWWNGTRARPGLLLLRELQRAGLNVCPFAREPDELGCGDSLLRTIGDGETERSVRRHAAAMFWRTTQSEASAAWTAISLRAWIEGDARSWLEMLGERVDIDAVAGPGADVDIVPVFAVPTLLRAAGRDSDARAAFDRAIERTASMTAPQRAVLLAEAAAQGRGSSVTDSLLTGDADPLAWRVALRAAEASGDDQRLASLLSEAPKQIAVDHARDTGALGLIELRWPDQATLADRRALAKWHETLDGDDLAGGRDALAAHWLALAGASDPRAAPRPANPVSFGVSDPARLVAELGALDGEVIHELARIAIAYIGDPAVADRLARDFVDGAVAVGQRAPLVAELFARLGDPARSRDWHTEALRSSEHNSDYLMAAGAAEAATQNLPRADVLFIEGAARSGDAGAANLAAARAYLRYGAPLEAIGAGRRALELTAPGLDAEVMELLVKAMLRLSREDNASDVLVAFTERPPEPFRDAARAAALRMWGEREPTQAMSGPLWRSRRERELRGEVQPGKDPMDPRVAEDVDAALRWNPRDVAGRAARLKQAKGKRRARLIAELLAIGLSADRARAVIALEAIAEAFERMGKIGLAEKARDEAKALR